MASVWVSIRGYLLNFVVPIAIRILSDVIASFKPQAIEKITEFFQGIYDDAVASGDATIQSLIVSVVAPIFGITIVTAPVSTGVLSAADIKATSMKMLAASVAKIAEEEVKEPFDERWDESGG